ncbi:MAG: NfeD family protein [Verrucomicrobia bacterium]|nr:NfeD family protein [Verrucomicrobiota bacterium]
MEFPHILTTLIEQDPLLWFSALAGTGMFLIQLVLTLIGMGELDTEYADAAHFKWLSKQTLTGFLMFFGWTALTCRHQFALKNGITFPLAILSGLFAAFLVALLFRMTKKLHSSGTQFSIDQLIGQEATVYQQILPGSSGKVTVSLGGMTYEIDAVSPHPDPIPSFSRVKILQKRDSLTAIVSPE